MNPTSTQSLFSLPTSIPTNTITTTGITPVSATTSTTTSDSPIIYSKLQDITKKYTAEFVELQKTLFKQAAEVTDRDMQLISNNEKITRLAKMIEDLKVEQDQMDQQLEFMRSQKADLEESLTTLEKEIDTHFPEMPADNTYKMAVDVNARFKKLSTFAKEIVEKINEKYEGTNESSNPMVVISQILNHHTNSIQHLDIATKEAQAKLEELSKKMQDLSYGL